jgi:hypothetical protein
MAACRKSRRLGVKRAVERAVAGSDLILVLKNNSDS